jgi:general nucleoside transport system permease protein
MTQQAETRAVLPSPPALLGGEQALARRAFRALGPALLGGFVALVLGALLIRLAGADPLAAYTVMVRGAFGGQRQLTETILQACPLLIIGLGLAVAFRSQVWNIGAEGQYFMGALTGGFLALQFGNWPQPLLVPLVLAGGLAGGALWALIAGLLRTRRGISEIITTLMLNYVAILLMQYLVRGPLRDPAGYLPQSAQFADAARLPVIWSPRIHLGIMIALLLVPLVHLLVWRTPLGFRLRAIGSSPKVAQFAGMNVGAGILAALLMSGALAGLAGVVEVTTLHLRLKGAISGGYGFSAILVALLGRMNPLGILLAAFFFAALTIGAEAMHAVYGLPAALSLALQAIIVLFVLAADAYFRMRNA